MDNDATTSMYREPQESKKRAIEAIPIGEGRYILHISSKRPISSGARAFLSNALQKWWDSGEKFFPLTSQSGDVEIHLERVTEPVDGT